MGMPERSSPSAARRSGERARLYVHNIGPTDTSSFHVIGTIFDRVGHQGNLANEMRGMQTVLLGASNGAVVEFIVPEDKYGVYPFVDHEFADATLGAVGKLRAGPIPANPMPDSHEPNQNAASGKSTIEAQPAEDLREVRAVARQHTLHQEARGGELGLVERLLFAGRAGLQLALRPPSPNAPTDRRGDLHREMQVVGGRGARLIGILQALLGQPGAGPLKPVRKPWRSVLRTRSARRFPSASRNSCTGWKKRRR